MALEVISQRDNAILDSLLMKSKSLGQVGKRDSAMVVLMEVIRTAEKESLSKYLAPAYQQMGFIQHFEQKNDKALEYLKKAIQHGELVRDSFVLSRAWLVSGIIEFRNGNVDKAVEYFKRSAEISQARGDSSYAALALSKIGNAYEEQGDYQAATPYFDKLLRTVRSNRDTVLLLTAYINFGGNQYNLRQYPQALAYTDSALQIASKIRRDFENMEVLQLRVNILEKMGRHSEALLTMRQYTGYKDSTQTLERNRQIAELELQYETEKKETQLLLQANQLRQGRLITGILIAALLVALMVGWLLYRLTRKLRKSNEDKEWLIKEIHHRVKNNLQVLSSLLYLQSQHIKDETALGAVREGQTRVEAMSLIHQRLYMGDQLAAVDMPDYLRSLGETLLDTFGMDDEQVAISYEVEPIRLDVDTAIPLGLIVNELITNSLKYAFADGRKGLLEISLHINESGKLCLVVEDNGPGAVESFYLKKSTSFGSSLVDMLSKKLKGTMQASHENGYQTLIEMESFKLA